MPLTLTISEDALARMVPQFAMRQATEPFMSAGTVPPERFGAVPKSYVRASLDQVMSPAPQDRMLSGWDVDQVFTLESSHFPLMSIPERPVDVLSEAGGIPARVS